MATIWGIIGSCLGQAIAYAGIPEPIKLLFSCLCCFDTNIRNLKDEDIKLESERRSLQMSVDTDENNAQVVDPKVKTWLEKVSEIQGKMTQINIEITTTQNSGFTVILISRFSLTKKVKETAKAMEELRQSCKFGIISHPPPPAATVSIRLGSTFEFDSRKHVEKEIMVSLRDKEANMLGICGMGGVGKTTMAKRIMNRAREELGFEETVMAVVSQKVDILGIQGDIAKQLGLELKDKKSLSCRAHDLRARLRGRKRSLIVLDDIWEKLKLEDVGICCDSGCKILLTSRDSDIFKRMDVDKVHAVRVLSETEAWVLFKSKAGSCIEQENVVSVAQQVVQECKGLPIALVTVGVALKDSVNILPWKDALHQLKSFNPKHMPEVLEDVYKPLRFSYESLKTVEEKSLFLLCCLFPEDYDIPLEDLAIYAMGLRMFGDITSLERAREKVCFLVERLKSCFLLLEGDYGENHVKMHDVVRDVAIFIASDEKWINCNDCTWVSPNTGERFELHVGSAVYPNLHLLLIDRESRDEELEIDDDFFKGMRELNVFSIESPSLPRLPLTTKLLKNLKTLILVWCQSLESISVVGELDNLEILICRWCMSIESLPMEMGRLSRLRLLELSCCGNLKTISPGIISNQKGLEELIVEDFDNWEAADEERERKNASLSELHDLPSLTRLKIKIKDSRLSEQIRLSPNMVKYDITIGDVRDFYSRWEFEKAMKLKLAGNISLGKWIDECIRSVEYMSLEGSDDSSLDFGVAHNMRSLTLEKCSAVKKLVNITTSATVFPVLEILKLEKLRKLEEICDIDGPMQSNSFKNLKELRLECLPALEHLWKTSISPYQQNVVSIFNKLSSVYIYECHRLRSLFSLSLMARSSCLVQLEKLEIWSCDMMEQVFLWNEEENQTNIHITLVFPKLKSLKLLFLPRLTSFCKGIESIEFPLLDEMKVVHCPLKSFVFTTASTRSPDDDARGGDDSMHLFCRLDKVKFGRLKVLELEVLGYDPNSNCCPQIPIDLFAELRELKLSGCKSLKSLFSLSMRESSCLLQLEKLEIWSCDMMEQVFLWNEEENQTNIHITLVFPKLKSLKLLFLPRLTSFCKGIESIEFPLLDEMKVVRCPLKSFVFTTASTRSPDDDARGGDDSMHLFCRLDKVKFGRLKVLELEVLGYDPNSNCCPQIPIDLFAELRELKLSGFKSLKSLFSLSMRESNCLLQLERLERLEIIECDMMEQVLLWDEQEDDQRNIDIPLVFPNLKLLTLSCLPRLTSFSKGIFQGIEFPRLDQMTINNCPLLKGFVCSGSPDDHDDDVSNIHFFCKPHKVKFGCLKVLELEVYGADEMRNWCPQIPLDFFVGLHKLKVFGYKGIRSLFSLSMTASNCLLQLERLEIKSCDMMEHVLLWNEEENQRNIDHIKLVFPKLKFLSLKSLPTLMRFSKGIESIEFPLLEEMNIYNCPLLNSFVSTGSSDDHDDGDDDSIHFLCKPHKVKFDCLKILEVHDENVICRNIWCRQIPVDFAGLCELRVSGFKSLKSLFSLSVTESGCFLQLEKLEISECDMMEQVLSWNEEENQTNIHITLVFPKLEFLSLKSLPRLTSLSKGIKSNAFLLPARMQITNCPLLGSCVSTTSSIDENDGSIHLFCKPHEDVEFGSLKKLEIGGFDKMRRNWCPQISTTNFFAGLCKLEVSELNGMKSLFPCSIARNLRNLRELKIEECEEMVKVIEDDACGGETQTPPNSLFPNLERLNMWCLMKLKSFCEWRCALHLPKLTSLVIYKCDVMEEFTSGPLNTPILEEIKIDFDDFSGKDVNTALQLNTLRREE